MSLQKGYSIDFVLVIDSTSKPSVSEQVKKIAVNLDNAIVDCFERARHTVEKFRIRVIDYSDYITGGADAIRQSEFYTLPQDKPAFIKAVDGICREGREKKAQASNGLEALYTAIDSDWTEIKPIRNKGRHVVALFTDNYPLHLAERKNCEGCRADEFPSDIYELENIWNAHGPDAKISNRNKRLWLFAPEGEDGEGHSWNSVMGWCDTTFVSVDSEDGLKYIPFDMIFAELIRSF